MSTQSSVRRISIFVVTLVTPILFVNCGGDDGGGPAGPGETFQNTFPASWAGEWDMVLSARDCETGTIGASDSDHGVICPGATADFVGVMVTSGDNSFTLSCDAKISETNFEISCSGPGRLGELDCVMDFELKGPRDGDSFVWNGNVYFDFELAGMPSICIAVQIDGTRTTTSTAGCPGAAPQLSFVELLAQF